MRKILSIAWKDTLLRFSGWSRWLTYLVLPIFFTVVLAGGTGGGGDNRVRLVVVDQAKSPLSADLVAALQKSEAVRPDGMSLTQAEFNYRIAARAPCSSFRRNSTSSIWSREACRSSCASSPII